MAQPISEYRITSHSAFEMKRRDIAEASFARFSRPRNSAIASEMAEMCYNPRSVLLVEYISSALLSMSAGSRRRSSLSTEPVKS